MTAAKLDELLDALGGEWSVGVTRLNQFEQLFGIAEHVELLNLVGGAFSEVQRILWDDLLLCVTRLTDSDPRSLTVYRLRATPLPGAPRRRRPGPGAAAGPAEAAAEAVGRGWPSSAPCRPNTRLGATSCPSPWPTPGPPSCSSRSASSTSTPSTVELSRPSASATFQKNRSRLQGRVVQTETPGTPTKESPTSQVTVRPRGKCLGAPQTMTRVNFTRRPAPRPTQFPLPLDCVPEVVRAHGLREAHSHPLVAIRTPTDEIRSFRTTADDAWREINPYQMLEWPRTGTSYAALVLDCDSRESVERAYACAMGAGPLPTPNVTITRLASGNLHAGWMLQRPVLGSFAGGG